jgi:hypothetical protein
MIRKASILLGLSVFLPLLFPIATWIRDFPLLSGAYAMMPISSRALASVALAAIPAFVLLHHAKVWQRLPESGLWIFVLAACSLFYIFIHMEWTGHLVSFLANGDLGRAKVLVEVRDAADVVAKVGALISLVGVLINLRPSELALGAEMEAL